MFGEASIALSHGGIEMGQGINTKVAQTVANELKDYGVTIDMIKVKAANNLVSPNNCVTGGSTTSELTCNVRRPTSWLTLLLVLGKNHILNLL